MKTIKKKLNGMAAAALPLLAAGALLSSCTNLEEKMYSDLEIGAGGGSADAAGLLVSAYDALNPQHQQGDRWGMNEYSTDEAVIPTRGGDWDDGGAHRSIHLHIWNADHPYMSSAFESLNTIQFRADNVLAAPNATAQQKAEARFIRAFAMYDVLSLWGFTVHREDLQAVFEDPAVMGTQASIDFIQQELEAIIADLPAFDKTKAYIASKDAARFLLMKLYLNKGTFLNRENPDFPTADMDSVLSLAAAIKATGVLSLSVGDREYFDNFAPTNDQISKENIYTLLNSASRGGNMANVWKRIAHPNMNPFGWNGAATLQKFYESYNADDVRLGMVYDNYPGQGSGVNPAKAVNVGFLVGQQYDLVKGTALVARNPLGDPLVFVPEIPNIRTSGKTLETAGVRVYKYPFDYEAYDKNQNNNNDWVVFRYADLLLMEAEAILRGGTPGTPAQALAIVNDIRAARYAGTPFTTLTFDDLLAERGRELYWEGWRREDLIRFGKFLEPNEIRTTKSDPIRLLYAVPTSQLAVNPNLKQNPGY